MPRYTPSYARMCHTGPRPIVRPMSIEKAIEGARESGWEMADMVIDGYMADDPRLEAWEQQSEHREVLPQGPRRLCPHGEGSVPRARSLRGGLPGLRRDGARRGPRVVHIRAGRDVH